MSQIFLHHKVKTFVINENQQILQDNIKNDKEKTVYVGEDSVRSFLNTKHNYIYSNNTEVNYIKNVWTQLTTDEDYLSFGISIDTDDDSTLSTISTFKQLYDYNNSTNSLDTIISQLNNIQLDQMKDSDILKSYGTSSSSNPFFIFADRIIYLYDNFSDKIKYTDDTLKTNFNIFNTLYSESTIFNTRVNTANIAHYNFVENFPDDFYSSYKNLNADNTAFENPLNILQYNGNCYYLMPLSQNITSIIDNRLHEKSDLWVNDVINTQTLYWELCNDTFVSGNSYIYNDIVKYTDNKYYRCILAINNCVNPSTDTQHWTEVANTWNKNTIYNLNDFVLFTSDDSTFCYKSLKSNNKYNIPSETYNSTTLVHTFQNRYQNQYRPNYGKALDAMYSGVKYLITDDNSIPMYDTEFSFLCKILVGSFEKFIQKLSFDISTYNASNSLGCHINSSDTLDGFNYQLFLTRLREDTNTSQQTKDTYVADIIKNIEDDVDIVSYLDKKAVISHIDDELYSKLGVTNYMIDYNRCGLNYSSIPTNLMLNNSLTSSIDVDSDNLTYNYYKLKNNRDPHLNFNVSIQPDTDYLYELNQLFDPEKNTIEYQFTDSVIQTAPNEVKSFDKLTGMRTYINVGNTTIEDKPWYSYKYTSIKDDHMLDQLSDYSLINSDQYSMYNLMNKYYETVSVIQDICSKYNTSSITYTVENYFDNCSHLNNILSNYDSYQLLTTIINQYFFNEEQTSYFNNIFNNTFCNRSFTIEESFTLIQKIAENYNKYIQSFNYLLYNGYISLTDDLYTIMQYYTLLVPYVTLTNCSTDTNTVGSYTVNEADNNIWTRIVGDVTYKLTYDSSSKNWSLTKITETIETNIDIIQTDVDSNCLLSRTLINTNYIDAKSSANTTNINIDLAIQRKLVDTWYVKTLQYLLDCGIIYHNDTCNDTASGGTCDKINTFGKMESVQTVLEFCNASKIEESIKYTTYNLTGNNFSVQYILDFLGTFIDIYKNFLDNLINYSNLLFNGDQDVNDFIEFINMLLPINSADYIKLRYNITNSNDPYNQSLSYLLEHFNDSNYVYYNNEILIKLSNADVKYSGMLNKTNSECNLNNLVQFAINYNNFNNTIQYFRNNIVKSTSSTFSKVTLTECSADTNAVGSYTVNEADNNIWTRIVGDVTYKLTYDGSTNNWSLTKIVSSDSGTSTTSVSITQSSVDSKKQMFLNSILVDSNDYFGKETKYLKHILNNSSDCKKLINKQLQLLQKLKKYFNDIGVDANDKNIVNFICKNIEKKCGEVVFSDDLVKLIYTDNFTNNIDTPFNNTPSVYEEFFDATNKIPYNGIIDDTTIDKNYPTQFAGYMIKYLLHMMNIDSSVNNVAMSSTTLTEDEKNKVYGIMNLLGLDNIEFNTKKALAFDSSGNLMEWSESTVYVKNNVRYYDGQYYECIKNIPTKTSGDSVIPQKIITPLNTEYWECISYDASAPIKELLDNSVDFECLSTIVGILNNGIFNKDIKLFSNFNRVIITANDGSKIYATPNGTNNNYWKFVLSGTTHNIYYDDDQWKLTSTQEALIDSGLVEDITAESTPSLYSIFKWFNGEYNYDQYNTNNDKKVSNLTKMKEDLQAILDHSYLNTSIVTIENLFDLLFNFRTLINNSSSNSKYLYVISNEKDKYANGSYTLSGTTWTLTSNGSTYTIVQSGENLHIYKNGSILTENPIIDTNAYPISSTNLQLIQTLRTMLNREIDVDYQYVKDLYSDTYSLYSLVTDLSNMYATSNTVDTIINNVDTIYNNQEVVHVLYNLIFQGLGKTSYHLENGVYIDLSSEEYEKISNYWIDIAETDVFATDVTYTQLKNLCDGLALTKQYLSNNLIQKTVSANTLFSELNTTRSTYSFISYSDSSKTSERNTLIANLKNNISSGTGALHIIYNYVGMSNLTKYGVITIYDLINLISINNIFEQALDEIDSLLTSDSNKTTAIFSLFKNNLNGLLSDATIADVYNISNNSNLSKFNIFTTSPLIIRDSNYLNKNINDIKINFGGVSYLSALKTITDLNTSLQALLEYNGDTMYYKEDVAYYNGRWYQVKNGSSVFIKNVVPTDTNYWSSTLINPGSTASQSVSLAYIYQDLGDTNIYNASINNVYDILNNIKSISNLSSYSAFDKYEFKTTGVYSNSLTTSTNSILNFSYLCEYVGVDCTTSTTIKQWLNCFINVNYNNSFDAEIKLSNLNTAGKSLSISSNLSNAMSQIISNNLLSTDHKTFITNNIPYSGTLDTNTCYFKNTAYNSHTLDFNSFNQFETIKLLGLHNSSYDVYNSFKSTTTGQLLLPSSGYVFKDNDVLTISKLSYLKDFIYYNNLESGYFKNIEQAGNSYGLNHTDSNTGLLDSNNIISIYNELINSSSWLYNIIYMMTNVFNYADISDIDVGDFFEYIRQHFDAISDLYTDPDQENSTTQTRTVPIDFVWRDYPNADENINYTVYDPVTDTDVTVNYVNYDWNHIKSQKLGFIVAYSNISGGGTKGTADAPYVVYIYNNNSSSARNLDVSLSYTKGEIVRYSNHIYICKNTVSGCNNTYSSSSAYNANDEVMYNSQRYKCKKSFTTVSIPSISDTTYWENITSSIISQIIGDSSSSVSCETLPYATPSGSNYEQSGLWRLLKTDGTIESSSTVSASSVAKFATSLDAATAIMKYKGLITSGDANSQKYCDIINSFGSLDDGSSATRLNIMLTRLINLIKTNNLQLTSIVKNFVTCAYKVNNTIIVNELLSTTTSTHLTLRYLYYLTTDTSHSSVISSISTWLLNNATSIFIGETNSTYLSLLLGSTASNNCIWLNERYMAYKSVELTFGDICRIFECINANSDNYNYIKNLLILMYSYECFNSIIYSSSNLIYETLFFTTYQSTISFNDCIKYVKKLFDIINSNTSFNSFEINTIHTTIRGYKRYILNSDENYTNIYYLLEYICEIGLNFNDSGKTSLSDYITATKIIPTPSSLTLNDVYDISVLLQYNSSIISKFDQTKKIRYLLTLNDVVDNYRTMRSSLQSNSSKLLSTYYSELAAERATSSNNQNKINQELLNNPILLYNKDDDTLNAGLNDSLYNFFQFLSLLNSNLSNTEVTEEHSEDSNQSCIYQFFKTCSVIQNYNNTYTSYLNLNFTLQNLINLLNQIDDDDVYNFINVVYPTLVLTGSPEHDQTKNWSTTYINLNGSFKLNTVPTDITKKLNLLSSSGTVSDLIMLYDVLQYVYDTAEMEILYTTQSTFKDVYDSLSCVCYNNRTNNPEKFFSFVADYHQRLMNIYSNISEENPVYELVKYKIDGLVYSKYFKDIADITTSSSVSQTNHIYKIDSNYGVTLNYFKKYIFNSEKYSIIYSYVTDLNEVLTDELGALTSMLNYENDYPFNTIIIENDMRISGVYSSTTDCDVWTLDKVYDGSRFYSTLTYNKTLNQWSLSCDQYNSDGKTTFTGTFIYNSSNLWKSGNTAIKSTAKYRNINDLLILLDNMEVIHTLNDSGLLDADVVEINQFNFFNENIYLINDVFTSSLLTENSTISDLNNSINSIESFEDLFRTNLDDLKAIDIINNLLTNYDSITLLKQMAANNNGSLDQHKFIKYLLDIYNKLNNTLATVEPIQATSTGSIDISDLMTQYQNSYDYKCLKQVNDDVNEFEMIECAKGMFKYKQTESHKSNIYSIRIKNSDLSIDGITDSEEKQHRLYIRQLFENVIKDHIKKYMPAHTHLWKIEYED